jgi:hypothetical protein
MGERPDAFFDPNWYQAERINGWRQAWKATAPLPPLLAAAVVWDAWCTLLPEQQGPWRAMLLASLVLKVRGRTRDWLLPLDTGQWSLRKVWRASEPVTRRLLIFFDIVEASAKHAASELEGLAGAKERMQIRIRGVQKNARLPDLIDLFIAKPIVSIPMACKAMGVSKQAIRQMLPKLGSTPREISERRRYRYWTVP